MDLREFAERVLHGTSLALKLLPAGELTDVDPGGPRPVERPTRPPALAFSAHRLKDELPTDLDDARERGRLLHRFANHELLALEIMASTLLRFPDAPRSFRLGLARTMAEEQTHLRLYLERMAALGVEPGEVPVNDAFWRCTESIASPYDYVLRMALTFEQANLDFTRTWRERFAALGDQDTVAALDVVYRDEIGHVRSGLQLFRQWKDPSIGEWEAFETGLAMPLSPARARGPEVDRAGRLAAGFTPEWIDRIELYSRSRGRPPAVWTFNPSCEDEVARGRPGFQPDTPARQLAEDLAPLLIFAAAREDVVVTPRRPSPEWQRAVTAAGFPLPEFVETTGELRGRKLGALRPWGASPDSAASLVPLGGTPWLPSLHAASDKVEALAWRREFLQALAEPWLVPPEGEVCTTLAEAEALAARGWMLKAPFSTAGRARRRGPLDDNGRAWASRVLAEVGRLRAEPWRDRVADLSFHLDIGEASRFIGTVRFDTTPAGQFTGTRPGRWLAREPAEVQRLLTGEGREPRRLRRLGDALARHLGPRLTALGVTGPVGVDAFIYRDADGLRLDPLVEVNARLTMGRLSLALEPHIHPMSNARWRFLPVRSLPGGAAAWFAAAQAEAPLEMERGLLRRGRFATSDPATARAVLTVLELG